MSSIRSVLEKVATYTMSAEGQLQQPMMTWQWGQGVALYALTKTYESTQDERILDYVEQWLDHQLREGEPGLSINTTAPILAALRWMILKDSSKYRPLCERCAIWLLEEAPRSLEGTYEHSCTENEYPNEIWADTLFMGCIFLVEWGSYTGNQAFLTEASRQFLQHYKYLADIDSGLIYHGYYGNDGMQMGVLWGRGNGWFTAASADVLPRFIGLQEYEAALHNYKMHVYGAISLQHSSGAWHTVMNDSNTYLETSVTAAFAYSLNEGVRKGLLTDVRYHGYAKKAIQALIANIDSEGRVLSGSGGTCVMSTAAEYNKIPYHITPFSQGLAMLALCSESAQSEANL
ncbi:MAG TPA: glycoside hydrolase family 88 protein [Paenibacillus sp.]|jgi:unsaturated rhamnogalacturonyl hydrolase